MATAGCRIVHVGVGGVVGRAQLDPRHVGHPGHAARRRRVLMMMSPNCCGRGQPAQRLDVELVGAAPPANGGGWPTEPAATWTLWLLQGAGRCRRRSGCARRPCRGRSRCAWNSRAAARLPMSPTPGTRSSASRIVQADIVGDVLLIERAVGRVDVHRHQEVGRALRTVTPVATTSGGSCGVAVGDPVLHQHLGLC